jgi:pentatricopeptide repeat protein
VPDRITLINLLSICAKIASLDRGHAICTWAVENGFCEDVSDADLLAPMIAMYAKCGAIEDAERCFGSIDAEDRSLQTWNAMMGAYSRHGRGRSTIGLFAAMMRQMSRSRRSSVVPDELSFLALLLACSHDGRADDGQKVLMSMLDLCGFPPSHNHYTCVLDLLGRAGRAEEALALAMDAMPVQPSGQQFRCVLSNACCWASPDVELVASHVVESGLLI